jgi:oligopeptide transport system substrate-binding protein
MRKPRWMAAVVMPMSLALVITSCSGDDGGDEGGGGGDNSKNDNATISVFGTEPERPLVPSDTTETGGGKIVDALFTGLVDYDVVTGEPKNAHAENIETSDDGKEMTFTLKEGWTFHDGTPVTASSYVDAWNFAAYTPNAIQNASFFAQIEGFDQVNTEDPDGVDGPQTAPTPPAQTMSGLEVVDELTFKVTFTAPHPIFWVKLGYPTFSPMPQSFFDDRAAYEASPVGNGPWQFESRESGQNLVVSRWDDYKGEDKGKVGKVQFTFMEGLEAAYGAVQGDTLDFTDTFPPSALAGDIWQTDLEGRSASLQTLSIQAIAFPLYDPKYQSVDFRKAISMAIDREAITEEIFNGNRKPVDGYGVPNLPGWTDGACAELCKHDPEEAKRLFDASGFTGRVEITSNADGGHQEWIEAACGQITNALGVECAFVPVQTFGEVRELVNARQMTQIYRAGWLADYPHVENFLNPLYKTGGSSNDNDFSNPAVDALLAEADATVDEEAAFELYHQAEELIAQQMPAVPLWNTSAQYGWSTRLKNVRMKLIDRELDLSSVEIA